MPCIALRNLDPACARMTGVGRMCSASKHAEMLGDDGVVELDPRGFAAEHHRAGIDDDDVVGEVRASA